MRVAGLEPVRTVYVRSRVLSFFKRLFTWWNGSTIGTSLQIRRKAVKVGEDEYGNQYFESTKLRYDGRNRRYVIYTDYAEASKVPPVWNGWLHHTYDELPSEIDIKVHGWQESHIQNMTGTPMAYKPKGSLDRGGVRDKVAADYEAWTPGDE